MKQKSYREVLDLVAADSLEEQAGLWPQIAAKIEKKTFMKTLRARPALVILIALLILLALSGVAYAIGKSLGYIPSIGLVEQSPGLRTLAEPVSVERDGIRMTILKVITSPATTLVRVQVEWLTPPPTSGDYDPSCQGNPSLSLPNGTTLNLVRVADKFTVGELGEHRGYGYVMEFAPIPSDQENVTFLYPCLVTYAPGPLPRDWKIPFHLVPAQDDVIIPVVTIAATAANSSSESPSGETNLQHGITASLDSYVPLEDGYLLIGSMQWNEKDYPARSVKPSDYISVTDATGEEILFESIPGPGINKPEDEDYRSYWAIKVLQKNFVAPLTVRIDGATVNTHADSFDFDPGLNPIPGQSWDINWDFKIGDIQAHIVKASLTTVNSPDWVFQFDVQTEPNTLADIYMSTSINKCMGGGGGMPAAPSETIQVIVPTCRTDLPPGPLKVGVDSALIWGPWQVEWTPPETSEVESPSATASADAEACLTGKSWEQALNKHDAIPSGLTGKLVLANPSQEISMVNLDGSELKIIGQGDSPSLSPDGNRMAITGPIVDGQPPNGLYIIDLASGNTTLLPGTAAGDSAPIWSPDGIMIAFTRGPAGAVGAPGAYNIMVMNADGSNLRQITFGNEWNQATAWTPDSAHIVYIVRNGIRSGSARMVDVRTGEISQLFETSYGYGSVVISPEGNRAAYEDWLPGDTFALYVSDINGSNRKLLAQGKEVTVVIPAWSPDGQWVIVSVFDSNSDSKLALIQVDTCQIIPLPKLTGYVGSWLP